MGTRRSRTLRIVAVMTVAAGVVLFPVKASWAATGPSSPTAPGPSRTTLPPLPAVPPTYTDGRPAQTLLSNAIALSSLGQDNSALVSAVALTQARLDRDSLVARTAEEQAAAANRRKVEAQDRLSQARATYSGMSGAIRQAVVYLYTSGPEVLTVSPRAGALALYAQDYAYSTLGPYGVLARSQALEQERSTDLRLVRNEAKVADAAAARAARAVADGDVQLARLRAELRSDSAASATLTVHDHLTLAGQAGKQLLSQSALQFDPKAPLPRPISTTAVALTWSFAELGKEYVWGATGPDTFDCSGLTQFVWKAAGVAIPRVASDQYRWTIPVPLSQLLPGDLVFFGTTDIHHVGIYIGDGLMINAPHTGTVVQVSSIWWSDLAGFGRIHYPGTPVPPHSIPTPARPERPVVTPAAGPVPSQVKPPAGWKAEPGSSAPIRLPAPPGGSVGTTTSSSSTSVPPPTAPSDQGGPGGIMDTTTTTSTTPTQPPAALTTAPPSSAGPPAGS